MSGHRGHINSRPAREIFLTSSSLSFSSLSSSVSWDDAIEHKSKEASCEDKSQQNGELSNASSSQGSEVSGVTHVRMQPVSSQGSEISGVTHVRMQPVSSQGSEMSGLTHVRMEPAPSPPSRLRPVPMMNRGIENYDPERIPASVFGKTGDVTWSEISNESLFSLKFDGYGRSNAQASRQRNLKPEEVLMSGEFLRYSPSPLATPQGSKEKRSEVKEIKSGETRMESLHQKKYLSTPDVPLSSIPSNFYCLYQAPPKNAQSVSLPAGNKKSKKIKKTRKSKKKKKKNEEEQKNKKNNCFMWSWLCSVFSKCECDLSCYKWRNCCCCCCCCRGGPNTMVL